MSTRRPDSHRRTPARPGGSIGARATMRTIVGALVVLAVAFASPTHLWLAHHGDPAAGHGALATIELVAGPGHCRGHHHPHHDGGGHAHHHEQAAAADSCDTGHDHPGPCSDPVEDCDLCLALSFATPFFGGTVEVPGAFVGGEMAASFEGTTRDIWGPATATSRGPPRRA